MSQTPPMPRLQNSITIRDLEGREFRVPGRTYRGLGMHVPQELDGGKAVPIPQVARDQYWAIVHVPSGLRTGTIRGATRAAWAALCRVADAADWTRPQSEVCRDPECRRLSRMLGAMPAADEVLP